MPHHKSAEKRVLTNEKSRVRNGAIRSRLRRSLRAQRAAEKPEEAVAALPRAISEVDVARRKGVIPAGRADRLKSRLAKAANRLKASGGTQAAESAPRKKAPARKAAAKS